MKKTKIVLVIALSISFLTVSAQEKKIKFNKGTLKICSSRSFVIEGYDGDEVIVESLHSNGKNYFSSTLRTNGKKGTVTSFSRSGSGFKNMKDKKGDFKVTVGAVSAVYSENENDTLIRPKPVFFKSFDNTRKEGLKKLGKKNTNKELGIYFIIEQNKDELIFKDNLESDFIMSAHREQYKIKIPNSLKLNWTTNCTTKTKERKYFFFNLEKSSLSNFDGEVAISSSVQDVKLNDVTGPVTINTIGGNVTVVFDKKTPKKLYSIYSNNGFIDISLPTNSSLKLDATASDIFSDIDFKLEEEKTEDNLQKMKLKLNSGRVTMKLNAGLGNIYLRKK